MAGDPEGETPRVNPYDEQAKMEARLGFGGARFNEYRPLEELNRKDILKLEPSERELIKEALTDTVLNPLLSFSGEINSIIEGASAKKYLYSSQNALERMTYSIAQTEGLLYSSKTEENEKLVGIVLREQVREKSLYTIHNWALPYLSMYWNGMGSLSILSDRGAQLPMADMSRFFNGSESGWVDESLQSLQDVTKKMIPLAMSKDGRRLDKISDSESQAEKLEVGETVTDRLARYTAQSDFWNRIRGEMNTFNPLAGEKLEISEAMQSFISKFSVNQPRIKEDGTKEKLAPKTVAIYFDANHEQIPQDAYYTDKDAAGNEVERVITTKKEAEEAENKGFKIKLKLRPTVSYPRPTEVYIDTLDYFNKAESELDRRWIIATTSAMVIENAKQILDSLPDNVHLSPDIDPNTDGGRYKALCDRVKIRAEDIMRNYDVLSKSRMEQKFAQTAFNLAYAMSFGNFEVGDWGWSYGWKTVWSEEKKGFVWMVEGSQGDPTASGDAFTARRPYFHEVVYAAVKNRVSSMNAGVLMPVDGNKANDLANALLSETEEMNQRNKMVERLKKGEQPHIARYFGVLGAYKDELGSTAAWIEGEGIRNKTRKTANENLIKTIEKTVMFVPTPFKDEKGDNIFYPILMPQFQIGLYDMMSIGKEITVGDLLRKRWITDSNDDKKRIPDSNKGKRLTIQDINWNQYNAYTDDARAVNDNFISQVYTPLYGALNGKSVEAIVSNPVAAITSIIKAVDIGARKYIKKLKDGSMAKRPSYEIMYGSTVIFQNLALGVHNLIGRGGVLRYKDFIRDITPGEKKNRTPDNLYTVLRSVEDFLPNKQGYSHYSDSFYLTLLAMAESLEPIVLAADTMAHNTTKRMENIDTTDIKGWNGVFDKNKNL